MGRPRLGISTNSVPLPARRDSGITSVMGARYSTRPALFRGALSRSGIGSLGNSTPCASPSMRMYFPAAKSP